MAFVENYITTASIALQPYRGLVGQTAAYLSIAQMLSPVFMFNNMRKAKSTLGMPILPFILITVLTSLSVRFSQLLNDDATFKANSVGFAASLVYISIFYHYASPKEKFSHLMKILGAAAFVVLVIVYSKVEDPEKIELRFGFILTALMYCLFSMPILGIHQALTKKCTQHLPLPMIVPGVLVGFCWLLHGIIINSKFVIAQHLVMLCIDLFQLSLFLIYPSVPASESKETKSASKKEKTK